MHPKDGWKVLFSVCQSIPRRGGYSIWLTGGLPPSQVRMVGTPFQGQDGGTPFPGEDEGSPSLWKAPWGTPLCQDWMGYYSCWDWMGYPPPNWDCWDWIGVPPLLLDGDTPIRTGWGTPHQSRLVGGIPRREIGRQSSYAAGSMPLALMQEDFLVFFFFLFFFCNMPQPKD